MGVRANKISVLFRYLVGTTGSAMLSLDKLDIKAPHPYRFSVTTARKLQVWHDHILHDDESGKVNIHIRWDNNLSGVDEAWVGMKLDEFVPLLAAHMEKQETERRTNAPQHRW